MIKSLRGLFLVLLVIASFIVINPVKVAADPLTWLDNQTYNLQKIHEVDNSVPAEPKDCVYDDVYLRHHHKIGGTTYPEVKLFSRCMTDHDYGREDSSYLQLNGSNVVGEKATTLSRHKFNRIKNSPHAWRAVGGYDGSFGNYFGVMKNISSRIVSKQATWSTQYWTHEVTPGPEDKTLKDGAGNKLPTYNHDFSKNGNWMVTNSLERAVIRVNIDTLEAVPIHAPFCVGCGYPTTYNAAISNDGRWAVVAAEGAFKIIDVNGCAPVPSVITGPVSCPTKNLTNDPVLNTVTPSRSQPFKAEFVTNNIIKFYMTHGSGSSKKRATYLFSTEGVSLESLDYLALGDSYASGEGAHNYVPETDTSENDCHLSKDSYPYMISEELGLDEFKSIACSGARIQDIITYSQKTQIPNPNSLGEWLPGKNPQLTHVERVNTDVITVSISGNDIGFENKLKKCIDLPLTFPFTCYDSYKERMEIVKEINAQYPMTLAALKRIKSASSESTKIYVTGYPRIAKTGGDCAVNVRFNAVEVDLANKIVDHLNYVIKQAAIRAGVKYVDISDALAGRRLCETGKSNVAVNGLTAGNQLFGVLGKESYHPNYRGQQMIKNKVLEYTDNFEDYSLPATSTAVLPTITSSTALELLDRFLEASGIFSTPRYSKGMTVDYAKPDDIINLKVNGVDFGLKPSSSYILEMRSTPVSLGTFVTDSEGNLDVNVTIPSAADWGFHELHILGDSMTSEPIDVYQGIFVAISDDDYDGDSVLNEDEECLLVEASGLDTDQDGIDDACDEYIDYSPAQINGIYRVRNGDPLKSEPIDRIYIERDVALAYEMFGVNDYDEDEDGWSLVGVSDASKDFKIANYKVEDRGLTIESFDRFVPTVSVRTEDKGCVQMTASKHDQVLEIESRELEVIAEDTDTCRSAPPEADTDANSIADNEQTLYRARLGDTNLGESSDKVYIERNLVASEAILGQSDYSAGGEWSLLGVSGALDIANLNNFILVDSDDTVLSNNGSFNSIMLSLSQDEKRLVKPVVLYKDSSSACKAIVAESLGTVKIGISRLAIEQNNLNHLCI